MGLKSPIHRAQKAKADERKIEVDAVHGETLMANPALRLAQIGCNGVAMRLAIVASALRSRSP